MRALLVVTVLACVAAIAFIAAVENQPDAGQRELVASSWPAKHQGFYYWSDSTAKQGEVREREQAGGAGGWRHTRRRFSYGACDALLIIPVLGLWRANAIDG